MSVRVTAGACAAASLLFYVVPVSWAQGGGAQTSAIQREYTVFVELRPPYGASRTTLQIVLKADGYESFPEGEREVALVLTEAQIGKLFQGRVRYRKVEASASAGTRAVPYLEGARIPARFEKLMRRVYVDPQRG
jgi:hypothetical protein